MGVLPLDLHQAPRGKYAVIYTDPCWAYYGDPDKDQAAGKHYNMMTYEELRALPVRPLAAKSAVVLMWATGPKLDEAVDLLRAWGFYYRGIAYVWVKTTNAGQVIHGQGVRPSFTKPTTELVLVGSTHKTGRTLPLQTEAQGQVVFAPRGAHSEKPLEVRERIEELFGDVPRLEMFARTCAPGWDVWGNEAGTLLAPDEARSDRLKETLAKAHEQRALADLMDSLPQES